MRFQYCNSYRHCKVCGSSKHCRRKDGLHFCRRRHHGERPLDSSLTYLSETHDGVWGLYADPYKPARATRDLGEKLAHQLTASAVAPDAALASRAAECSEPAGDRGMVEHIAATMCPLSGSPLQALAQHLQLPTAVFATVGTGWLANDTYNRPAWVFPEKDGDGLVIGYALRYADGTKRAHGRRGLIIPEGWADRPGPLFLPEGASDTLAMTAMGLAAVGRPSNTGGVDHLARLLRGIPNERPIVVVGENDRKSDGRWPGRAGASLTANRLMTRS